MNEVGLVDVNPGASGGPGVSGNYFVTSGRLIQECVSERVTQ